MPRQVVRRPRRRLQERQVADDCKNGKQPRWARPGSDVNQRGIGRESGPSLRFAAAHAAWLFFRHPLALGRISGIVVAASLWEGKMNNLSRIIGILGIGVLGLGPASSAWAAGYDTPMLYSASHMGMGGTAISSVDDPSAVFHNPAGLSRTGKGMLHLDVSPLGGQIQGSPDVKALSVKSNFATSPFFMLSGAYQLIDRVHIGFAAYLLGGAAGKYEYNIDKNVKAGVYRTSVVDSASLGFIEFAPALSVRIIDGLTFGAAWRPLYTTFERERINTNDALGTVGTPDPQPFITMKMKGMEWTGFRVGLQYEIAKLKLGVVYRNQVRSNVGGSVYYGGGDLLNAKYAFILPSKLGIGAQVQVLERLRLAVDFEYMFNSENTYVYLAGDQVDVNTKELKPKTIPNSSYWSDSFALRVGAGFKVSEPLEVRAGYVYDARAANPMYPTAFGSPPGPTNIATAGVGYTFSPAFDMSFATAYRHGAASTSEVDTTCPFCGKTGDYAITLVGAYIDARYRFGLGGATGTGVDLPAAATPVTP